jgi:hypothetical protein
MRNFILICLLAIPLVGYAGSAQDEALQTWYSSNATLEQRAKAVEKLVPKGASRQNIAHILGTNGTWTRQSSRSVGTQVATIEYLAYRFPDGDVCLFLDPLATLGGGFEHAGIDPTNHLITVSDK